MAKKKSMEQLRGVVNMGREAEESMEENIHISVYVDPSCPRWLALAIRDALVPERDAVVDALPLSDNPAVFGTDVGIIVAGHSEDAIRSAIHSFVGVRQHVIVVAESSLDIPDASLPAKLEQFATAVVASETGPLLERFANALLGATDKLVSCAANFAFCRDVATARLVSKVAARNALMSIADFIPGAGMLLTMNQVNLGFDIAATYGHGLSLGRIPEVITIIAAGIVYRDAALLISRFVPALGIFVRVGVAYFGTLMTGRMLASHFTEALPAAPTGESPERSSSAVATA
ncbi:MAG: hypothetical protein IKF78_07085 [Atopobiaceae bacterium]|nr:hypothetical protein [Atopobiaceae bacterium]